MIKPSEVCLYVVGLFVAIGAVGVAYQAVSNAPTQEQLDEIQQPLIPEPAPDLEPAPEPEDPVVEELEPIEPTVAPQGVQQKKYRRGLFPRLRNLFRPRSSFQSLPQNNLQNCPGGACPNPQ